MTTSRDVKSSASALQASPLSSQAIAQYAEMVARHYQIFTEGTRADLKTWFAPSAER